MHKKFTAISQFGDIKTQQINIPLYPKKLLQLYQFITQEHFMTK